MKKTVALIIVAVVFVGWTLYNLVTGIAGLSKSGISQLSRYPEVGTRCEVYVDFANESYTVNHSLNYLIPTGAEHFYFAISEDGAVPLLIKASQSWYDKNFDKDGFAKDTVTLVCEVGKFDSDSRFKIGELNRDLSSIGESVSTEKYLNANYRTMYVFRVITGAVSIAAVAAIFGLLKLGLRSGKAATALTIFIISAVLFCIADMLVLEHL